MTSRPMADARDPKALLAEAYQQHGGAVYAAASKLCGPTAAEDVTHDVFLELWNKPDNFDPAVGSLRALLISSACARSAARPADESSLAQITMRKMPMRERDAIAMTLAGGCSYREAGVVLGVSEQSAKALIRHALLRLHSTLGNQDDAATLGV